MCLSRLYLGNVCIISSMLEPYVRFSKALTMCSSQSGPVLAVCSTFEIWLTSLIQSCHNVMLQSVLTVTASLSIIWLAVNYVFKQICNILQYIHLLDSVWYANIEHGLYYHNYRSKFCITQTWFHIWVAEGISPISSNKQYFPISFIIIGINV